MQLIRCCLNSFLHHFQIIFLFKITQPPLEVIQVSLKINWLVDYKFIVWFK